MEPIDCPIAFILRTGNSRVNLGWERVIIAAIKVSIVATVISWLTAATETPSRIHPENAETKCPSWPVITATRADKKVVKNDTPGTLVPKETKKVEIEPNKKERIGAIAAAMVAMESATTTAC